MAGTSTWAVFVFGLLGGVVPELLVMYGLRGKPAEEWRKYYGGWLTYVLPTAGMILAGGLIAAAYNAYSDPVAPLLALQIGASAPLIFGSFIHATPHQIKTGG